ncbi:MAG: hypothetical protein JKY95_03460 [Planctomycetaceae bacterium]|nr:hypothetical protein [Planctomycetaceae bacterium]
MKFRIPQVNQRNNFYVVIAIVFCLGLLSGSAQAQRGQRFGGGGRTGFTFRSPQSHLLRALRMEQLAEELKLTPEQTEKLKTVSESANPSPEMFEFISRMRAAQTDEEKEKIRAEISKYVTQKSQEIEKKIQELLSKEQFTRLNQVGLQLSGTRTLLSDQIITQLKISEDQKTKIQETMEAGRMDRREFFRLPEEEQIKQRQESEAKVFALLSEEQNKQWRELLGTPLAATDGKGPEQNKPRSSPQVVNTEPGKPAVMTPQDSPALPADVESLLTELQPAPASSDTEEAGPATLDFGTQDLSEITATQKPVQSMTFNFKKAPWDDVLRLFALTSGLTLDLKVSPPGTFNYFDRRAHTPTEALDVLNGYLIQRGFIIVKQDRFLIVDDIANGVPPNLVPTVNPKDLSKLGRNDLVRVVFSVGTLDASTMVEDVQSLLGPQGSAIALGKSNQLVVTGLVQNIQRIEETLINAKLPTGEQDIVFDAFQLRFLPADEAEITVRALLGVSATLGDQGGSSSSGRSSGSSSDDRRRQFMEMVMRSRGGGGPPSRGSSSSSSSKTTDSETKIRIAVDHRSNSLLITARPAELEIVRQALETIDLPPSDHSELGNGDSQKTELRVYEIKNADLNKIVETLTAMVPGILVNPDTRAAVLHIVASPSRHEEVADLIRLLGGKMNANTVAAIPLVHLDALTTAMLLNTIFESDKENAPAIQSDPYGRSLIVRGTATQVEEIRSLLLQMGEPAPGTVSFAKQQDGPIREIPLGGRDPEQLLKLIEKIWNTGHKTPLKIVAPGFDNRMPPGSLQKESPTNPPKPDNKPAIKGEEKPQPITPALKTTRNPATSGLQFNVNFTQPLDKEKETKSEDTSSVPPKVNAKKPTSIAIIGDRIVISSEDSESLQELDQLLKTVMSQIQPQMQWRVYYLNVASADDAAATLQQLIPDLSVDEAISPLGSSSPVGLTGMPFKLISDSNLNALFVTGPADRIRELEEVIRIIDSSDVPGNYRDQVPHTIPVMYANAVEVADILKDVFSDYLTKTTKPTDNRGGPGSRGGGNSSQSVPGQLSIGVDSRTSQIIVSCNESLFQQISELVKTLDDAAREARRTVRVVRLNNTDASVIKATLGTLLPQVTFSTSSTSGVSRSNSSSKPASGTQPGSTPRQPGTSQPSSDFFRDMMRRRMMESQQRGGGDSSRRGGSPFGQPGGFRGRPSR